MIVLIANDLPDAIRGKLKLWFVEPKPNVFVSGIKDSLCDRIIDLLMRYTPPASGFVLFKSISLPPYYQIIIHGAPTKPLTLLTGLQLIQDRMDVPASDEIIDF